jgi:DNA sulfur modification protein DndD
MKGASSPLSTDFVINAYHAGVRQKISDYNKFLNQFLPKDLIQFYLFDGEYLQHTATNSNLKIKAGLRKLFNIQKIENESRIIGDLVEEWYKQSAKMPKKNSEIADVDGNILRLLENKRNEEARMTDEEKTKSELIVERNALQEELSKTALLQEIVGKFKALEEKEKRVEQDLKKENDAYHANILNNAYLINAKPILQGVYKKLDDEPKVKNLPANVRQIFLNHLLKREKCVCGHKIEKGSDEEKSVISELNVAESEERLDFLLDLTYRIPEIMRGTEEKVTLISEGAGKIKKMEDERRKIKKDKEELQGELPRGKVDINAHNSNVNKLVTLSDDIRDAERNISTFKIKIQQWDDGIEELKDKRTKMLDKSGEADVLHTNIKVGEYLKKIFDRFNREVLDNVATELEGEINELISQNKKISELSVKITTEGNNIDFKFAEKGSTKHYLTGGQNQLFGIIIMAAFVRIMDRRVKEKLPFVFMDNPFSSIDKGSLEIASSDLSELFRNAQVILFTTNDKFDKVFDVARGNMFTAMTLINDGKNVKPNVKGE